MASKLTQQIVAASKAREKPYELRDGGTKGVRGLLLRIQPSGFKTYYLEFGRGKRVRIGSSAITLTQARQLAIKSKALAEEGKDPRKTTSPVKLGEFFDNIYTPYFTTHHRTDTSLANLAALKPLFDTRLSNLTDSQVKRWRQNRLKAGRKPATINRNVSALKTLLNHAVEEGYLDVNPLAGVSALKVEHPNRVRFLTSNEELCLRATLEAREQGLRADRLSGNAWRTERDYDLLPDLSNLLFADHLKPMVILTMNTGLRRGELFQLKWADITADTLTVTRSKSGTARHLPLNREARDTLEGWRATGTERWIFENNGQPFDNVNKAWNAVLVRASIADFRWHDLRHHFASKLVMAAVPLNTVRELLGHSDIKMTLRYAHLAPGHMREAVEAISS